MLMFHGVVADLYQNIKDYCLVDVTYEATELGIVRNGALQYCTNTAIGLNTLVRGLAKKLDIPHEEAHSFLREPYYSTGRAALSETKLEAMDSLLAEYLVALTSLFNETADTLSIPRVVFLHGNTFANAIVRPQVTTAAKMSAGSSPTVYDISDAILTTLYDTADRKALELVTSQPSMLLAAQFFHKPQPWHSIVDD